MYSVNISRSNSQQSVTAMLRFTTKWVRWTPNGTNLGLKSSYQPNTGPLTHSHNGLGIIVKNQYTAKFKVIIENICQLDLDLENKKTLSVIAAYAPTLSISTKNRSSRYVLHRLEICINSISNNNQILLGIDSNAQLGT